jgi:hypothetical protein
MTQRRQSIWDVPPDVEIGEAALPALSRSARGADSTKESNAMNKITASTAIPTRALKLEALSNISTSWTVLSTRYFQRERSAETSY